MHLVSFDGMRTDLPNIMLCAVSLFAQSSSKPEFRDSPFSPWTLTMWDAWVTLY